MQHKESCFSALHSRPASRHQSPAHAIGAPAKSNGRRPPCTQRTHTHTHTHAHIETHIRTYTETAVRVDQRRPKIHVHRRTHAHNSTVPIHQGRSTHSKTPGTAHTLLPLQRGIRGVYATAEAGEGNVNRRGHTHTVRGSTYVACVILRKGTSLPAGAAVFVPPHFEAFVVPVFHKPRLSTTMKQPHTGHVSCVHRACVCGCATTPSI